ncbi:hypothetical protein BJY52DRAFT_933290 [Lactarius psammicola]|nr:hypothetical protein BJY52DRAFT_933290 [Lactarius psammicola]
MQELAQTLSRLFQKRGKKRSPKGAQPVSVAPETSGSIYIRVRKANLHPGTFPDGPQLSGHLYLIRGTFEEITRYAGNTVDWVIKMAHLLCEPLGDGRVYTHTTGTPTIWQNSDRDSSWQEVVQSDPLYPRMYEFESTSPITLSKISDRHTRSVTNQGPVSRSNAAEFRRQLEERDNGCVVCRWSSPLVASHLIPRRVHTENAIEIVKRFVGPAEARDIHDYHPMSGVMLFSSVDHWVDLYQAGFYHITNNTYTLHNFTDNPALTYFGAFVTPGLQNIPLPLLHGYSATLSVHAGEASLPPPGVFNWHYLQCVIKKFGTDQYRGIQDIHFFRLSLQNSIRHSR